MATNIRPITSLRQRCRASKNLGKPVSFTDDERGIAALEFAIIAPVILGVYLGLASLPWFSALIDRFRSPPVSRVI